MLEILHFLMDEHPWLSTLWLILSIPLFWGFTPFQGIFKRIVRYDSSLRPNSNTRITKSPDIKDMS